MSWWRPKTPPPRVHLPKYIPPLELPPKPEPIEVVEEFDPNESAIFRIKEAIAKKWRG